MTPKNKRPFPPRFNVEYTSCVCRVYPPWLKEIFKMVSILLENAFTSQKIEFRIAGKLSSDYYYHPLERNYSSSQTAFFFEIYPSLAERRGGVGKLWRTKKIEWRLNGLIFQRWTDLKMFLFCSTWNLHNFPCSSRMLYRKSLLI